MPRRRWPPHRPAARNARRSSRSRASTGSTSRRRCGAYDGPRDPDALLAHFGYAEFRPGQREAVEAALAGRDSLVVMPTGGGKSLCYQLPGIATANLTIVVSPLIALMADQYRRLILGGHPAAMIASGMDEEAVASALRAVRSGEARIVFCSPERFASSSFLSALSARAVDLFVVDEAHCVSEWGHDFRPDYLRLRGAIDRLGSPTVMACTATATEQVAEEIRARLGLRDPFVVRSGFDRPNLSFDVVALEGKGSKARKQMLLSAALADPASRPSIVYCGTRRDVEEVTERLRADGLQAVGYHAGMAADERASAQHRFMEGDADVVVATNAFGMGVDKADVRSVIHWAIPKSVEAYYQEAGRGGPRRRAGQGDPARDARGPRPPDQLHRARPHRARGGDALRAAAARLRRRRRDRDRHTARGPRAHLARHRGARRALRARARSGRSRAGHARRQRANGARVAGGVQGRTRPRLARLPRGRGVRLARRAVPAPRAARPLRRLAPGRAHRPVLRRLRSRHARACPTRSR